MFNHQQVARLGVVLAYAVLPLGSLLLSIFQYSKKVFQRTKNLHHLVLRHAIYKLSTYYHTTCHPLENNAKGE